MTSRELNKKTVCLGIASRCGALALARYATRSRGRILAYHGVASGFCSPINYDGFFVDPETFRTQLDCLVRSYCVVPLSELTHSLAEGPPLPENAVALTFDDGYRDNILTVAPILQEYGMPATFFVTTGFIDGRAKPWWHRLRAAVSGLDEMPLPDSQKISVATTAEKSSAVQRWEQHLRSVRLQERESALAAFCDLVEVPQLPDEPELMSWEEVKTLSSMGFEVGPHTVSHISIGREPLAVVEDEIRVSTSRFEEMLKTKPRFYSYPYGSRADVNERVFALLSELGYDAAVTTEEGFVEPGVPRFSLPRLNVGGDHDRLAFQSLVSGFTGMIKNRRVTH